MQGFVARYCYARPYHEYLGLSGGIDFETKIFVKHRAPELLREFLTRDDWQPELIAFSGVTDCYQPAERDFRLTRGCLEVAAEARQGNIAAQIHNVFQVFTKKHGLDGGLPPLDCTQFRPPLPRSGQMRLF